MVPIQTGFARGEKNVGEFFDEQLLAESDKTQIPRLDKDFTSRYWEVTAPWQHAPDTP